MTHTTWDSHVPYPSTSNGQLQMHSGNGGSHGDVRERVRALEVEVAHQGRYNHDRICAHHDRLVTGDDKMARLSRDAMETKRQVLTNSEAIAEIRATQQEMHQQQSEMRAVAAAQDMSAKHRREARNEIAKLLWWTLLALIVIGAVTGLIPHERLKALQHLKMLPGL